jgi:environmental stress-induced protein Ves
MKRTRRPTLETRHLRPEDYRRQPWKNGRGETRVIAADAPEGFRWRLSWASVPESGPFSLYPGYDRILVPLGGSGISLRHGERAPRHVPSHQAYAFKGDWPTEATVERPMEDFNVLTLSGKARGAVYPASVAGNEDIQVPLSGAEHFVFCVTGSIAIHEPNTGQSAILQPGETFQVSRAGTAEYLNLKIRGAAQRTSYLWVVVHLS